MRFMGTFCHKTNISPKHLIYASAMSTGRFVLLYSSNLSLYKHHSHWNKLGSCAKRCMEISPSV